MSHTCSVISFITLLLFLKGEYTQYSLNRAAEGFRFLLLLDAYILKELVLEGSWSPYSVRSGTAGAPQSLERVPGSQISKGMSDLCEGHAGGGKRVNY